MKLSIRNGSTPAIRPVVPTSVAPTDSNFHGLRFVYIAMTKFLTQRLLYLTLRLPCHLVAHLGCFAWGRQGEARRLKWIDPYMHFA
jgi:hypothetical protein